MNRLQHEKSPYLRQHAENPVEWYPWGEEAFQRAAKEDKPIFLSIGYSTCHWCHVMAEESFQDDQIAALLNRDFVSVKVDREERPDVDAVYMQACQGMTGSGGWPLTILMTPEREPFFAATYLPKESRGGQIGLRRLLKTVAEEWQTGKERLRRAAREITLAIRETKQPDPETAPPAEELIRRGRLLYGQRFDPQWGGFGSYPKFPAAHNLLFLFRYSVWKRDPEARKMAEKTLEQMYRGGIFDHIGGGFSRYSTDRKWLVPHFEKMLYDNALLICAYLEGYRLTGRQLFAQVAIRTLDYVMKELYDPDGGFFCGQDADSEGEEGKYYLFTREELIRVLGETDGELFCRWFDIGEKGHQGGKSVPNLVSNANFESELPKIRTLCAILYEYRKNRTSLHRDNKILTSWNSLMIAALCRAKEVLGEQNYLDCAVRVQRFLAQRVTGQDGRLFAGTCEGRAFSDGMLDDYAFYAYALLRLYETTLDVSYLAGAVGTAERMTELFADGENGGFFLYSSEAEQLISRPKELYDGAMPSGNAAAAGVLLRLWRLTGTRGFREQSEKQLEYLCAGIQNMPMAHSVSLAVLLESLSVSRELVCACAGEREVRELLQYCADPSVPKMSVLCKTPENARELSRLAPFTADYALPKTGAVYYLCQGGACLPPVHSLAELRALSEGGR